MIGSLVVLALLADATRLPPLAVSGRDIDPGSPQATAELNALDLDIIRPTHPAEVFSRLPGTWITRGSGQEHLSAVRSPLLSGAGGCGALLILEDGIPIRPPGFCNVNNLFEVNLIQAASVQVQRGPGGIGHASGGLHGVIDVRTRSPRAAPLDRVRVEGGDHDRARLGLSLTGRLAGGSVGLDLSLTRAGSFRIDEGHDHQFLTLSHERTTDGTDWRTTLAAARLDQDTAGFILGRDEFRDPEGRRANLNPEAFRRASAVRLTQRIEWLDEGGSENRLSLFARRSRMTFLQHFLPGKPLERNGQVSTGLQFDRIGQASARSLDFGLDVEVFRGFLFQAQANPAEGSPFLRATRPVGRHYDYDVDGQRVGGYIAARFEFGDDWQLRTGVHADWVRYDYSTRLAPGNRAEDGSECGFGGCLYNRPADRDDQFANFAPEITLSRALAGGLAWLRVARGFRAPQATELYRLQRGQDVAELDSEVLDAVELGIRGGERLSYELVGFVQRKKNFIFRDAEGFNVSDGRTRHRGVEAAVSLAVTPSLVAAARGTWARHEYRFDRDLGGERIVAGNDISSAPRRLYSADLTWRPQARWQAQVAFEATGSYWLDAANTRTYEGHRLWHLAADYEFRSGWELGLRVRNLLNRRYAERADFAFGNYRYFPGAGRTVTAALTWEGGAGG